MDKISFLPDDVIEKILLSMPLIDAVRTCVLSKTWRYKWTRLPKLILGIAFFLESGSTEDIGYDYLLKVKRILLQHSGHLEELYIAIPDWDCPNRKSINELLCLAMWRGVRKLTILNWAVSPRTWPLCFPPSQSVTHLDITLCVISGYPFLGSFQNLTSLHFNYVSFDHPATLTRLISICPNIESITLHHLNFEGQFLDIYAPKLKFLSVRGKFRSIYLQGGSDVREMELHLYRVLDYCTWRKAYLTDFFGCLVRLKSLRLGGLIYQVFRQTSTLSKLPTMLGNLENLELVGVDFSDVTLLHTVLCFIRSSHNLCSLEITVKRRKSNLDEEELRLQGDDSERGILPHLREVHIDRIMGTKNELEMLKFLFKCAPALEEIYIWHAKRISQSKLYELHEALERYRNSSPNAKILVSQA